MRWLVDKGYPEAAVIRVVLDNLSTHTAAALYQTFAPEEARRLARKLEFHYTPKHASWLNMAEIEFSVLERQCLDRRLATRAEVERETAAWTAARNQARATIHWHFTTAHARTRLHRLYPSQTQ
jgi:transposase